MECTRCNKNEATSKLIIVPVTNENGEKLWKNKGLNSILFVKRAWGSGLTGPFVYEII